MPDAPGWAGPRGVWLVVSIERQTLGEALETIPQRGDGRIVRRGIEPQADGHLDGLPQRHRLADRGDDRPVALEPIEQFEEPVQLLLLLVPLRHGARLLYYGA